MACLDEDTIVAFVGMGAGAGARLSSAAIEGVDAHVHGCAACRDLLSAALAAAPRSWAGIGRPLAGDGDAIPRGTVFGRYTVLDLVGRGAMGEVYAAYDPGLDRKVALKILNPGVQSADSRSRDRLLREARAIAKLRDPHVVVIHEAGTLDDRVFLAMEYVEGETLEAWLAARPRSSQEIVEVFTAAGRGLAAAHAAGIVHRDFKPQNVMVDKAGGVRVMDFGLAREMDASGVVESSEIEPFGTAPTDADAAGDPLRLTKTGELVGTPLYMAPEQFRARRADARSDQFTFCVALYRALYGAHPFAGVTLGGLMASVMAGRVQPAPPRTSVPLRLRRVLLRGLAVHPEGRWESMQALTAALGRSSARLRRRWLAAGAILAALVAAVLAVRPTRSTNLLCRGGPALLVGVWEPATEASPGAAGTRRAATRAAFLATGVMGAADAWQYASRVLDRYVADWLSAYEDSCAATHLRGEQSAEVLDLRMSCLHDRLDRVRALTDLFVNANGAVVANAVPATSALPVLEPCADVKQLRAVLPPPETREARERLAVLRKDLARVKALSDSGQCVAAAAGRRQLVAAADALGYPPMQADALMASLHAVGVCDDPAEALGNYRRAALIALAARYDEVAAEAAILEAATQADRTVSVTRARDWIDLATAIMQRMSADHPALESWRLQALATVYSKEGNVEAAVASGRSALALIETLFGREHWDYWVALSAMGQVLFDARRYAEAVDVLRGATEIATTFGGLVTPLGALLRADAAEPLIALGRYTEARAEAQQALEIWRNVGASAFYQAFGLAMLGEALLGEGRAREAAVPLEQTLSLMGDSSLPYVHGARFALARALWESPPQRPRARLLARQARGGYERAGNRGPDLAQVDAWLRTHR